MAQLPILSGNELVGILEKVGYRVVRQRGSHMRLAGAGRKAVTVPNYKTIDRSLLRKILRDSKLSVEVFLQLL